MHQFVHENPRSAVEVIEFVTGLYIASFSSYRRLNTTEYWRAEEHPTKCSYRRSERQRGGTNEVLRLHRTARALRRKITVERVYKVSFVVEFPRVNNNSSIGTWAQRS